MTSCKTQACLFCMEPSESGRDYHPSCSRKFFGASLPPRLEYGLVEMESLASKLIRTHEAIPGVQAILLQTILVAAYLRQGE